MCSQFLIAKCLLDFLKKTILIAFQLQANYSSLSHTKFLSFFLSNAVFFFFLTSSTSLAFPINQQKHWVKVSPRRARQSHVSAMWLCWDSILPPGAIDVCQGYVYGYSC